MPTSPDIYLHIVKNFCQLSSRADQVIFSPSELATVKTIQVHLTNWICSGFKFNSLPFSCFSFAASAFPKPRSERSIVETSQHFQQDLPFKIVSWTKTTASFTLFETERTGNSVHIGAMQEPQIPGGVGWTSVFIFPPTSHQTHRSCKLVDAFDLPVICVMGSGSRL